jgi:hypothetical protein
MTFIAKNGEFLAEKRYASRLETESRIKILTENGRVRYGVVGKFGAPTVPCSSCTVS